MYKKLGASGIFAFSGKTIDKLPDKLQILSKYESNFNGGCYSISGFSPITSLKITSDNDLVYISTDNYKKECI